MPPCTPTEDRTELEFVAALYSRTYAGGCRGPLLLISLLPARVVRLERLWGSAAASDLLWSDCPIAEYSVFDVADAVALRLCAAHWFDLATLAFTRAGQRQNCGGASEAEQLLRDLCMAAGWDAKEIVNMFAWRRARLT